jgi:hypothetical protein
MEKEQTDLRPLANLMLALVCLLSGESGELDPAAVRAQQPPKHSRLLKARDLRLRAVRAIWFYAARAVMSPKENQQAIEYSKKSRQLALNGLHEIAAESAPVDKFLDALGDLATAARALHDSAPEVIGLIASNLGDEYSISPKKPRKKKSTIPTKRANLSAAARIMRESGNTAGLARLEKLGYRAPAASGVR